MKYQYKTLVINGKKPEEIDELANALGAEGWEMVGAHYTPVGPFTRLFFKKVLA